MRSSRRANSPETRRRAATRLRRLTGFAILLATGGTVVIGVAVANEHPGASTSSATTPTPVPTTSPPSTSTTVTPPPTTTSPTSNQGAVFTIDHHHCAPNDNNHSPAHNHDDAAGGDLRRYKAMSPSVTVAPHASTTERTFRALGTTATVVVTDRSLADEAESILREEVEAIDRACSRFRPDSELAYLQACAGRTVEVSPLLFEALDVAYSVAARTHGAVDPTVGRAVEALGYDRDFEQIQSRPLRMTDLGPAPGFRHLHLDHTRGTARIPEGVRLDLGSSAKALVADKAAAHIAQKLGSGALVSIGGDIAVAGKPPPEGWAIGIAVDSATGPGDVDQVVAIRQGGLASSSTEIRRLANGIGAGAPHRGPGHRPQLESVLAPGLRGRRQLRRCQRPLNRRRGLG